MRSRPISLAVIMLLSSILSVAQQPGRYEIRLRGGSFTPEQNIPPENIEALNQQGKALFVLVQFDALPTTALKDEMRKSGVHLLDFVAGNAYTASIDGRLDADLLKKWKVRAIVTPTPEQKMESSLANGQFPHWAVKSPGTVEVWISFPKSTDAATAITSISESGFNITSTEYSRYRILVLNVSTSRLKELASLNMVEYVQSAPKEAEVMNDKSILNGRGNILNSSIPGGRNLKGDGVVVGVGDNSNPLQHIDFSGRVINRSSLPGGSHGIHVMGTVGGAGNLIEKFAGYAPKSTILKQNTAKVLTNSPVYVQDHGMVITNNSYGIITDDCVTFGIYDLWSRMVDMQMREMISLQHVFSAGNSGTLSCSPYPSGFGTVLGSFQSAKNVISVGATDLEGAIGGLSSRGPVRDGRIKPEITTQGLAVISTWSNNTYLANNGTSMAAPAVSGGLALLYERYRQLNGGADPKNGLMKALLLNGANDKGNAGPDYTFGFGWMNLFRTVKMLEQGNYFNDSVSNGTFNDHIITVPANTAQLKVMLYWNDPEATPLAAETLVNDLDLEVRDAGNVLTLPFVLDTTAASVNNTATTGIDRINNVEQVVINNPAAGNFTVRVNGTTIAQGPMQEYFLVYDTVPVSATLTFPAGGEKFHNQDSVNISWDAFGNPGNDFTLQFSTDNSTWTDIAINVAADERQHFWIIPDTSSNQARVRLIHNGTGIQSTSEPFIIVGIPQLTVAPLANQCEGYFAFSWTTVPEATDYEVFMLRGEEMVPLDITTGNSYVISGLAKDTLYWATVRARIAGVPGRKATAVPWFPNGGSCPGSMSDFDLKVDAILAPSSGRELTSTSLGSATVISARFKNVDNVPAPTFNVKYSVNGGPFVAEAATNINAQGFYVHNFATTYDFSAIGDYLLTVVVENTTGADPVAKNDTMRTLIRHLPNAPITLSIGNDFLDDFESMPEASYPRAQVGIANGDRYDFNSSTSFGRLRTFVNSGLANSGNRALTLDADRYNVGGTIDTLKATFNLQPHFNTADDIRLDFSYKHHGQLNHPANRVWIRGSDTDPWIEVYNLYANQGESGVVNQVPGLQLSDLLSAASQDFSSSFQVRFGQFGQYITADNESGAGYTIDDLHLYLVENDLEMVSIDTPVVSSCGLDATVPVIITVRNNADTTINNVPVNFSIDGGAAVTEVISSIPGNTNIGYTFTGTADLSSTGSHEVKTWVDYPDDSYRNNDTVTVIIINSPVFTNFPYLENFESGDGGWYSGGENNSWAFGTPSSPKINRAASGANAWKTNLSGSHNGNELSYLYSPCYDLTGLSNPQLSFSLAIDIEDCGDADPQDDPNELCDGAYVEYSVDGVNWNRLGAKSEGTNWYNKGFTNNHLWAVQDYTRWHVATISLPAGVPNLRLRFVLASDPFVNLEGIAVDDIHIYDSVYSIYNGAPFTSNEVNQSSVTGSAWIDFSDGGGLIASINPNGEDLGSTNARVFINTGPVRISSGQFYHDRNITIKPTNVNLADSATVRFYFLDTETETLINATGCPGCSKPSMAYELGVSKYSDTDDSREDGMTSNNLPGGWLYIPPANVSIVPFAEGYYAEFKVKDFSEFWLNNGGINSDQTLPAELLSFTATKIGQGNVQTSWRVASELNVLRYEVELARGNGEFQQNNFTTIGEVSAHNTGGEQHYSFIDEESNKSGVRYYRLKIVDIDGRYSYSPVRPVFFNDEVRWQVYPNPSQGFFNLVIQQQAGFAIRIKVYDANGRIVYNDKQTGTGFIQKIPIDLQSRQFAAGMYLVEVESFVRREAFRLVKME